MSRLNDTFGLSGVPVMFIKQFSQTSLAMQSFLSGTISQQINTLLSSVINNNNWNFGANISTGTDGFYNAEYEGILSGKLLNNRLLLNGQFGYRDNPNTTNNFIGHFDMKYLLFRTATWLSTSTTRRTTATSHATASTRRDWA